MKITQRIKDLLGLLINPVIKPHPLRSTTKELSNLIERDGQGHYYQLISHALKGPIVFERVKLNPGVGKWNQLVVQGPDWRVASVDYCDGSFGGFKITDDESGYILQASVREEREITVNSKITLSSGRRTKNASLSERAVIDYDDIQENQAITQVEQSLSLIRKRHPLTIAENIVTRYFEVTEQNISKLKKEIVSLEPQFGIDRLLFLMALSYDGPTSQMTTDNPIWDQKATEQRRRRTTLEDDISCPSAFANFESSFLDNEKTKEQYRNLGQYGIAEPIFSDKAKQDNLRTRLKLLEKKVNDVSTDFYALNNLDSVVSPPSYLRPDFHRFIDSLPVDEQDPVFVLLLYAGESLGFKKDKLGKKDGRFCDYGKEVIAASHFYLKHSERAVRK